MKSRNIVKELIFSSIRENTKLFITQLLWAGVLGIFMAIVDHIYSIRVLPLYFMFLFVSTLLISKNSANIIRFGFATKRNATHYLYNNILPLTYFQKFTISVIQNGFCFFFPIISMIYGVHLLGPVFIDFSGYFERDVFTVFCAFQLFVLFGHVGIMRIHDRLTGIDIGNMETIKVLILNLALGFVFILVILFDFVLINQMTPDVFDNISTFYIFTSIVLIYDIVLINNIIKNAPTANEHKGFRFKQPTFMKQVKLHAQVFSFLFVLNILFGAYVLSQVETNRKAYQLASFLGFIEPTHAIDLLNDKPEEFVAYYKAGMPKDKKYKWLTEEVVLRALIVNDSLDVIKKIVPVNVESYDPYFCQLFSQKVCKGGFFLDYVLSKNSDKISRYLLSNNSYNLASSDFSKMMKNAAHNCHGRSIAALIDSGVSVKIGKIGKKEADIYDVLSRKRSYRCRMAMRDLLKQHLKN